MIERQKVFAYITRGTDLLVFKERGFDIGLQVPAGTLKEREKPVEGVIREAREETGLERLKIVKHLGSVWSDQRKYGINERHLRHFYHIECFQETPEKWSQEETDPDPYSITEDTPKHIIFDLSWIGLEEKELGLAEGHDIFIDKLRSSLGL